MGAKFWGSDENVLELVVLVAHLYEVCELYLNKSVIKKKL